jgi:hypothetical protein
LANQVDQRARAKQQHETQVRCDENREHRYAVPNRVRLSINPVIFS